ALSFRLPPSPQLAEPALRQRPFPARPVLLSQRQAELVPQPSLPQSPSPVPPASRPRRQAGPFPARPAAPSLSRRRGLLRRRSSSTGPWPGWHRSLPDRPEETLPTRPDRRPATP